MTLTWEQLPSPGIVGRVIATDGQTFGCCHVNWTDKEDINILMSTAERDAYAAYRRKCAENMRK